MLEQWRSLLEEEEMQTRSLNKIYQSASVYSTAQNPAIEEENRMNPDSTVLCPSGTEFQILRSTSSAWGRRYGYHAATGSINQTLVIVCFSNVNLVAAATNPGHSKSS